MDAVLAIGAKANEQDIIGQKATVALLDVVGDEIKDAAHLAGDHVEAEALAALTVPEAHVVDAKTLDALTITSASVKLAATGKLGAGAISEVFGVV
jgi:fructose-specific component phosphotransferase system IIB-like protein